MIIVLIFKLEYHNHRSISKPFLKYLWEKELSTYVASALTNNFAKSCETQLFQDCFKLNNHDN